MSFMSSQASPSGVYRKGSLALVGVFAAALAAHAQTAALMDDYEAKSNQNLFLGYSYFYADGKDGGNSVVTTSKPGATATELKIDETKAFDAGYSSTSSLKMAFTMGTTKPGCGAGCTYGQMVGFGTQFVPGTDNADGTPTTKTLDLTGATAITFYAKASAAMSMRVEVSTTPVKDYGYHRILAPLTTDWAKVTVPLNDPIAGIAQPKWAVQLPFDPKLVQKLQLSVSVDDNAGLTAGTVWIDNIQVENYTWVPPSACVSCIGAGPATGALLADCEEGTLAGAKRTANQNMTGGYWFAYNDYGTRTGLAAGDYSDIFAGVTVDPTAPGTPVLAIDPAKGNGGTGGAYIKFQLGKAYLEGTNTVKPFVGIGTKTSDNLDVATTNMTGSTGVAFDYMTEATSTFKFIRLEVKTKQTNLGTNAGAVHSVLIPATAGAWKTATIPWEKFSLPDWEEIPDKTVAVDTKTIVKFQWAVQDAPGTTGAFAIDNVKIPGMTAIPTLGIRSQSRAAQGMRLTQAAGRLDVAYALPLGVADAEVSLVDMKGSQVAKRSISGKGEQRVSLDTRNLNSGLYSLQVRHGNVVRGMAVTLLK